MKADDFNLNETQLFILNLFRKPMSKKQLTDLKKILVDFFNNQAQDEMDKIWIEKNFSQKKLSEMAARHIRTPYKQ